MTERALAFTGSKELMVVGGVAANKRLVGDAEHHGREALGEALTSFPLRYSGDCGAQIAWTGLLAFRSGV